MSGVFSGGFSLAALVFLGFLAADVERVPFFLSLDALDAAGRPRLVVSVALAGLAGATSATDLAVGTSFVGTSASSVITSLVSALSWIRALFLGPSQCDCSGTE